MALGQQQPEHPRVVGHGFGAEPVDDDRALHVPVLADVDLQRRRARHLGERPQIGGRARFGECRQRRPAEQRVTDRLQRLLVLDDALALVMMPGVRAVGEACQHRALRLLELQEQQIVGRRALQQGDEGPQSDRTDPDDLVGAVDQPVTTDDAPPLQRQRAEVIVQSLGDLLETGIRDTGQQRAIRPDLQRPSLAGGQLRQCTVAGSLLRLGRRPHHLIAQ